MTCVKLSVFSHIKTWGETVGRWVVLEIVSFF